MHVCLKANSFWSKTPAMCPGDESSLLILWALTYGGEYWIIKGFFGEESEVKLYNSLISQMHIFLFPFYALVLHLFGSCFLIQTTPTGPASLEELQVSPGHCLKSLLVNQPHHVSFDPFPALLSTCLSLPATTATSERGEKTEESVKRAIILKPP